MVAVVVAVDAVADAAVVVNCFLLLFYYRRLRRRRGRRHDDDDDDATTTYNHTIKNNDDNHNDDDVKKHYSSSSRFTFQTAKKWRQKPHHGPTNQPQSVVAVAVIAVVDVAAAVVGDGPANEPHQEGITADIGRCCCCLCSLFPS